MYDASSKLAMYASCLPSGLQAGLLTVAPGGTCDRGALARGRVDQRQPRRGARGQRAGAVGLGVHLQPAKVVVELPELVHRRQPVALLLEEVRAVGALQRQRHILLARRRHQLHDRGAAGST